MRPVILLAAVVAIVSASLCAAGDVSALPESKRLALAKAVSFAADAEQIKKADTRITQILPRDAEAYVAEHLGTNNLSTFLLFLPALDSKKFDCTSDPANILHASSRMAGGRSIVSLADLNAIVWLDTGEHTQAGSFRFNAGNAFKGRCLFEASRTPSGWAITRLVIARKDADALDAGLSVFSLPVPPNRRPDPEASQQHEK